MRKLFLCLLILFFTFPTSSIFSQAINHLSVDTVEVSYMSAPNEQVRPEVIIHLKTLDGISKVYCKIINPIDNNIAYYVYYDINNLPVSDSSGLLICLKTNNIIQIIGTNPIVLQGYIYQIQTEDYYGNISTNYTFTRELEP